MTVEVVVSGSWVEIVMWKLGTEEIGGLEAEVGAVHNQRLVVVVMTDDFASEGKFSSLS